MTDSPDTDPPLLEFPCHFPIKAVGPATEVFEARVVEIVRTHAPNLGEGAVRCRASGGGKYLSVTVTVHAESREQLDNIYLALTACEEVMMVL